LGSRIRYWVFELLSRIAALRPAPPRPHDFEKEHWRTSTGRMGVRFHERLRDRFRRAWLRLTTGGER